MKARDRRRVNRRENGDNGTAARIKNQRCPAMVNLRLEEMSSSCAERDS